MNKVKVLAVVMETNYVSTQRGEIHPPISLIQLTSYLLDLCEIEVIDLNCDSIENLLDKLRDFDPDIVITSGWIDTVIRANEVAAIIRKSSDAKLIIGGPYATIAPEVYLPSFDLVVLGAGVETFQEILNADPNKIKEIPGIAHAEEGSITFSKPRIYPPERNIDLPGFPYNLFP